MWTTQLKLGPEQSRFPTHIWVSLEKTTHCCNPLPQMIHGPHSDLHTLKQAHEEGLSRLLAAAAAEDMNLLGCGIQVSKFCNVPSKRFRPPFIDAHARITLFDVSATDSAFIGAHNETQTVRDTCRNIWWSLEAFLSHRFGPSSRRHNSR
jgi:hypothetical protein